MNKGYNTLWPTNIFIGDIENTILEKICQAIFEEVNLNDLPNNPEKFNILEEGSTIFQQFTDEVIWPAFGNYLKNYNINITDFPQRKLQGWITEVYSGYNMTVHNHNGSAFSAVFYLLCDSNGKGGELLLQDSRINANRGYKSQFKSWFENKVYKPKSGEFIIFPSHVYHQTTPFSGSIRLAMPVDLFL